jgi:heme/copper-type cytochrome/quinol oxidase subunit 2
VSDSELRELVFIGVIMAGITIFAFIVIIAFLRLYRRESKKDK